MRGDTGFRAKGTIFFNLNLLKSMREDNLWVVRYFSNRQTFYVFCGLFFFLFVGALDDMLRKALYMVEQEGLTANSFQHIFEDNGDDRLQSRDSS